MKNKHKNVWQDGWMNGLRFMEDQKGTCVVCGKEFIHERSNPNKYKTTVCGSDCRKKRNYDRQNKKKADLNLGAALKLSGGKIGKINEHTVAIDLIKRGYDVFTAFEDTHPFDILAVKDGKYIRIEVKTANFTPSGKVIFAMKPTQVGKHDILALVTNLTNVEYIPNIEDFNG